MQQIKHENRELIDLLRFELSFLEDGGYGRPVKTPRQPTIPFRDSPTCLNFSLPDRPHPCGECQLTRFVPADRMGEAVPCHHIVLSEKGETIESLCDSASQ